MHLTFSDNASADDAPNKASLSSPLGATLLEKMAKHDALQATWYSNISRLLYLYAYTDAHPVISPDVDEASEYTEKLFEPVPGQAFSTTLDH